MVRRLVVALAAAAISRVSAIPDGSIDGHDYDIVGARVKLVIGQGLSSDQVGDALSVWFKKNQCIALDQNCVKLEGALAPIAQEGCKGEAQWRLAKVFWLDDFAPVQRMFSKRRAQQGALHVLAAGAHRSRGAFDINCDG